MQETVQERSGTGVWKGCSRIFQNVMPQFCCFLGECTVQQNKYFSSKVPDDECKTILLVPGQLLFLYYSHLDPLKINLFTFRFVRFVCRLLFFFDTLSEYKVVQPLKHDKNFALMHVKESNMLDSQLINVISRMWIFSPRVYLTFLTR